jgi:integrase
MTVVVLSRVLPRKFPLRAEFGVGLTSSQKRTIQRTVPKPRRPARTLCRTLPTTAVGHSAENLRPLSARPTRPSERCVETSLNHNLVGSAGEADAKRRPAPPMPAIPLHDAGPEKQPTGGRHLVRPVRAGAPARRQVDALVLRETLRSQKTAVLQGGRSRLESQAVADVTKTDYCRRLDRFDAFCALSGLEETEDMVTLELYVLEYMDELFLDGESVGTGTKLLAALALRWPVLHRSRGLNFHRVRRALQGWGRLAPTATRLPIPWLGVAGIAAALLAMGEPVAALAVVLATDGYLRPGEVLGLTSRHVTAPRPWLGAAHRHATLLLFPSDEGITSKMGHYDDSVVLDSPGREWVTKLLLARCREVRPSEPLFPFTILSFGVLFKAACRRAGVEVWDATPHVLRHAGPSHDYLLQLRSLPDIKRRGRWSADRSVRRYEKSSQVNARLSMLTETTLFRLQVSEINLPQLFARKVANPFVAESVS